MNPIIELTTSIHTFLSDLAEGMCELLRRATLHKTWYENMDFKDLAGIHVRAKLKNGTILEGRLYEWSDDTCAIDTTPVLREREQKIYKGSCTESVDYLWNEKDYEQISWENLKEGDYVVSNGILMMVDSIERYPIKIKVNMNDDLPDIEIPKEMVSEVLRHKQDLPTSHGIYKADHCLYIMLIGSRKQWIVIKDDNTVELYEHDDLPVKYWNNIRN